MRVKYRERFEARFAEQAMLSTGIEGAPRGDSTPGRASAKDRRAGLSPGEPSPGSRPRAGGRAPLDVASVGPRWRAPLGRSDPERTSSPGPTSPARSPSPGLSNLLSLLAPEKAIARRTPLEAPARDRPLRGPGTFSWKAPRIPIADVVSDAIRVLGRPITSAETQALFEAHLYGLGKEGKDRSLPAAVGNFRTKHIARKAHILRRAGFSIAEIHALVKECVVGASPRDAAHHAIATDLYNGRIIDARPFHANENHTQIFWVRLQNPANGRTREALFKPRIPGDNDGWGRQPIEYVAYALNRMIGMDLVPPVAYRHHVEVAFQHFTEGAMIYLVPNAHLLHPVRAERWGQPKELFLSDARILDILIHNPDRQRPNYLRGRHWVDGRYRPMLIDHAAGFRRGTIIHLGQSDAFASGPIKVIRRSTLEGLKRLNFDWLKRDLGEFLSNKEIRAVLERRNGIVQHFERRAEARGWDKVVI